MTYELHEYGGWRGSWCRVIPSLVVVMAALPVGVDASPAWDLVDAHARQWKTIDLTLDPDREWLYAKRLWVEQRCDEGSRIASTDFTQDHYLRPGEGLSLNVDADYDDDGSTVVAEADSSCSYRVGVTAWLAGNGVSGGVLCDVEFSPWFRYAESADTEFVEVTAKDRRCPAIKLRVQASAPATGED